MIPVTNVRDFYAILYDFVYVGYETTVLTTHSNVLL